MEPQQPQSGGPAGGWQTPVEPAGPAPGIRFAGHGARLVAYLVDGFLLAIGYMVVFGVVALAGLGAYLDRDGELGAAAVGGFILLVLFGIVVSIAYFPFFWARSGQTPGMRLFRLRVVRDRDGGPISGTQAVMRLVGYWVNGVALYIGFAWILIDQRRRGWHDLIAGTVVIEDPR